MTSTAVKKTAPLPLGQGLRPSTPQCKTVGPRSHVLENKQQPALGTGDPCLSVPVYLSGSQGILPAEAWAGHSCLDTPESPAICQWHFKTRALGPFAVQRRSPLARGCWEAESCLPVRAGPPERGQENIQGTTDFTPWQSEDNSLNRRGTKVRREAGEGLRGRRGIKHQLPFPA